MTRFELQKLRDLPIEGVAEQLGFQVKMHKCLCPFHDDHHASMSFKVSKNTFRCFVCGASGGPIDLVMKHLNKPFLRYFITRSIGPPDAPHTKQRKVFRLTLNDIDA